MWKVADSILSLDVSYTVKDVISPPDIFHPVNVNVNSVLIPPGFRENITHVTT
jgi:hypothetical protein